MKRIILLVFVLGLCLPVSAKDKQHKLAIAYEGADYSFREPHTDYKDHFTANKQGILVMYTRQSVLSSEITEADPSFASFEFRYLNGKTDWQFAGSPTYDTNVKDRYMEMALKFGRNFQLAGPFGLSPYLGFGWREARRGVEPFSRQYHTIDNGISYEESVMVTKSKSTYFYVPVGTYLSLDMGNAVTLSVNGEFDWLIRGNHNAHAPGYFTNRDNLSVSLSKGYGLRLSAQAELDIGRFGFFAGPFWRYWKIQRSSKTWYDLGGVPNGGCTRTPLNVTREYGLRAGITF